MRLRTRRLSASIAALAATAVLGAGLAAPASAQVVPADQFGMHVPQIANGINVSVPMGTVRLWDSGVAWGQVEQKDNKFWWVGLDRAIQNAQRHNAKVLYVLGSTPKWAASKAKAGTYPNKGAASMPKNMKVWKDWVTAVVKRYKGSIHAYQIWNEANLSTFWQGTPKQMAQLTKEAQKIIKKIDPRAQVVAASTTVRLTSAYNKFFPKYLTELRKAKWPVDVYSFHSYPSSVGGPAERVAAINDVKAKLAAAGAPAKPLWDTEVNYGIAGPGPSNPDKDIDDPTTAAAWVAQTYLDDIRLGVAQAYWYFWSTPVDLVGIQMHDGSPAATAYTTTYNWLVNADVNCTSGAVNVCTATKNGQTATIAWTSSGEVAFPVPAGATTAVNALNQASPVTPGSAVTIGSMPTWFGTV